MLGEDIRSSTYLEQTLVIRSEELENYTDRVKESLAQYCTWSAQL